MSFQERVLDSLKMIPSGKVTTYKDIAEYLDCKAYRAVGSALNKNPHAPKVPCHRVVNSKGGLGGYAQGVSKKKVLLLKEGVHVEDGIIVDFSHKHFLFGKFK